MNAKSESTAKRSKKESAESKRTKVERPVKKTSGPTEDQIRTKAEELYRERIAKNIPGTQESDWLTAEKMLRSSMK